MFAARFEFLIFKIDGRPPARQRGRVLEYVRNLPHVSFDAPLVDEVIRVGGYDSDPLAGLIRINLAHVQWGGAPKFWKRRWRPGGATASDRTASRTTFRTILA